MQKFKKVHKVVLIRHGESTWNLENRFTGWYDSDLTPTGVNEARQAGIDLRDKGYQFDVAYTSVLQRSIKTYNIMADELNCHWIPLVKSWRLNERHYGALQGFNKQQMADAYGEEQVIKWRRTYDVPPPALDNEDQRHPRFDNRYMNLPPDILPRAESLKNTVDRVVPFWLDVISPDVYENKKVLIVSHMNSLRALVKHLSNMNEQQILGFNIPTATPLVYELDQNLKIINSYFDIEVDVLKKRQEAVISQRKKRL